MALPPRTDIRFSILGPLAVRLAGRDLPLGPLKQRLLLAMLLCRPNTPVSTGLLTDALWDGAPPRTARKNIQVYVSAVRRLLDQAGADGRLVLQAGGYLLRVRPDELDALRFQELVRAARGAFAQGAPAAASGLLGEALGLWRGPLLHDLRFSPALRHEAERLDRRYLQAYEDWAETELRLGNASEVAETVGELVERHPERERLRAAQMNALFDQGRQTEALETYEALRRLLAAEYGLGPSPALETLYRSMLSGGRGGPGGPFAPPGAGAGARAAWRSGRALGTLLPQDLGDFTGRAEPLRFLRGLLAERAGDPGRLTVLTGPVGVGKTALAVHAAHRLADAFPDGRVLVRMRGGSGAPRSAASVLGELTRLAGLSWSAGAGAPQPEEAAAAWRAWLAHRRVLLILDDCGDEAGVRPLVPDSGASAVLVTARTQLAGLVSARRPEVTGFDLAESVELLGKIVGPDRLAADPAAAERIANAAGLLPLAVRVCGLKLAVRRYLPLGEYAERLADSRAVLDELVAGDMDVRRRLASGWRDLSPSGRSALCLLAALPEGPFSLVEAAAALTHGQPTARRALESLLDAGALLAPDSEVTAHAALFELPRLLHVYAREQAVRDMPSLSRAGA